MSTLRNAKNYIPCVRQNKGILKTDAIALTATATASAPTYNLTDGFMYYDSTLNAVRVYASSAWVTLASSAGGSVTSWDALYDLDTSLTVDGSSMTFAGTHATNAIVTITSSGSGAGLQVTPSGTGIGINISNSGSGNDITGTSATWGVTAAGVATVTSLVLGDDQSIVFGASSDASIDWDATAGFLDIAGSVNFEKDVQIASNMDLTIAGATGETSFTITTGDVVWSDTSLSITDADNAGTVVITNATLQDGGNLVTITGDAVTTEALLYIDNGGGTLTGAGAYIDCNDGGTSDFKVGPDGATTITGASTSSIGLTVTGVQTNENTVVVTSSGVTATGKASLLLNPSGNIADNGTILRIAPSGTPVIGSIAISVVGTGKLIQAFSADVDVTTEHAFELVGSGVLNGKSMMYVDNDATPLGVASPIVNFTFTGTSNPNYPVTILKVNAAKNAQGVWVDVDNTTPHAVLIDGSGDLNGGSMLYVDNDGTPSGSASPLVNFTFTGTSHADYPVTILKVAAAKNAQAIWVDVDNTTPHAVLISGSGLLNGGNMLKVDSDANLTTAGGVNQTLVNFTCTGTTDAKNNTRILAVSAAKDMAGIYVDVDNTTPHAVSITGSGAINTGHMLYIANDYTPNAASDSLVQIASTVDGVSQGILLDLVGTNKVVTAIQADVDNITTHAVSITGSGALNAGSMLYIANDTTPNAASDILVEIASTVTGKSQGVMLNLTGTGRTMSALIADVDNTTTNAVGITGTGALNGGNMLKVDNDGTPAANTDAVVNFTFTGTATNNPIVLEVDNSTKDAQPLRVTSNVVSATRAVATLVQDSTTGGAAGVCLELQQDDIDVPFIKFVTTAGTSNAIGTGDKTSGSAIAYYVKVLVGTSTMWMQMYDEAA